MDRPSEPRPNALLVISIVLWALCNFGAALRTGVHHGGVGAAIGSLIGSLLIPGLIRAVVRAARRQPVTSPVLSPGLFFGGAVCGLLIAASATPV